MFMGKIIIYNVQSVFTVLGIYNFTFRRTEDLGGFVAFPLMVPVRPEDNYVADFREARIFLAEKWKKPTLIMYSDVSLIYLFTLS